jgi:hypothetical protein
MPLEIGHVEAIFRYPVKSMRGEPLEVAELGWHGIEGDRRIAFRRVDDCSGFPWLTATKLPALLLFSPFRSADRDREGPPTHVRTPDGRQMPVFGEELAGEIGQRHGAAVQMMELRHGIFDAVTSQLRIRSLTGQAPFEDVAPATRPAAILYAWNMCPECRDRRWTG